MKWLVVLLAVLLSSPVYALPPCWVIKMYAKAHPMSYKEGLKKAKEHGYTKYEFKQAVACVKGKND